MVHLFNIYKVARAFDPAKLFLFFFIGFPCISLIVFFASAGIDSDTLDTLVVLNSISDTTPPPPPLLPRNFVVFLLPVLLDTGGAMRITASASSEDRTRA